MLRRLLAARRDRRAAVERAAEELQTWLGDLGYTEARSRAREARGNDDRAKDLHWTRVADEIAKREGRIVGQKVADRYEADRNRPVPRPVDREIARALVDIATGIADLTRGRQDATTLHNIGAHVRHVIGMGGSTPDVVRAGIAVIAACEYLAAATAECSTSIAAGTYPAKAERAGWALQRLREVVDWPT